MEQCQHVGANRNAEVLARLCCLHPDVDAGVKCFGLVRHTLCREYRVCQWRPIPLWKGGALWFVLRIGWWLWGRRRRRPYLHVRHHCGILLKRLVHNRDEFRHEVDMCI